MTDSSIALQKAVMIPVDDEGNPEFDAAIAVQFNPESLKVTQSNTLDTGNSGGGQSNAAQFIDKSETSLSIQLIFDTSIGRPEETVTFDAGADTSENAAEGARGSQSVTASHKANSDVRALTKLIADVFMKPRPGTNDRLKAPRKCRFQWGTFAFVGMMSSYDETLDFFAPEGIPLRATLSLSFKEDRYQFENVPGVAADRNNPDFAPGGDNVPVSEAAKNAGKKPKDWRNTALFNGIESPRFSASAGLSVPNVNISAGASVGGFSAGLSGSLGTGLPGAFNASASLPGGSASFSVSGLSASAGIGGGGASASLSTGRFASAGAMAAGGVSAPGLSADGSAGFSGGGASAQGVIGGQASAQIFSPDLQGNVGGQIDLSSPTAEFDIDTA